MPTKAIELIQTLNQPDVQQSVHQILLKTEFHLIDSRSVQLAKLLLEKTSPVLLQISHHHLTTQIDFTGVTPYEIWYFDSEKKFSGKTFSFHTGTGTFRVETQARFIFLWNTLKDEDTTLKLKELSCSSVVLNEYET